MVDNVLRHHLMFADVQNKEILFLRDYPPSARKREVKIGHLLFHILFIGQLFGVAIAHHVTDYKPIVSSPFLSLDDSEDVDDFTSMSKVTSTTSIDSAGTFTIASNGTFISTFSLAVLPSPV